MVIRFGALPSCKKNPRTLVIRTVSEAQAGWHITTIKNAGTASRGYRQYDQFGPSKTQPLDEIDLYATLES